MMRTGLRPRTRHADAPSARYEETTRYDLFLKDRHAYHFSYIIIMLYSNTPSFFHDTQFYPVPPLRAEISYRRNAHDFTWS